MTKTCYLAGPMRGHHLYNFPAFFRAEAALKWHGWDVFNPAAMDQRNGFDPTLPLGDPKNEAAFSLKEAFTADFTAIMERDAIFLLPGWRSSTGAQAEYAVARLCGKSTIDVVEVTWAEGEAPVLVTQQMLCPAELDLEL